jgi:hypothetical protein
MMASFLGSAYKDGADLLVLSIDDGTLSQYAQGGIIRRGEVQITDVRQRLINLINQCPANYNYSYVDGYYRSETNALAHADLVSQGIYGVRKSGWYGFKWCRDVTSIHAMQDIIVGRFKNPLYEISVETISLKNMHIDIGDTFLLSVLDLYDENGDQLINNYWRVVSVTPDFTNAKINFRALESPYFLTIANLLDGSFELDGSVKLGNDRDTTIY